MSDWPKELEHVPVWARFVDKNGEPIRPDGDLVVSAAAVAQAIEEADRRMADLEMRVRRDGILGAGTKEPTP